MEMDMEVAGAHVTNVVNFILNNCSSKLPMKMSSVLAVMQHDKKLLRAVFGAACTALEEDYGIMTKVLPDSASGKRFICFSTKTSAASLVGCNATDQKQHVLLHLVLTLLLVKGSRATETKLKVALEEFQIYFGCNHEYFGDVKTLITDTFVKQLYLKKEKTDNDKIVYSWGFRSHEEFDKKNVLSVVAKDMGKSVDDFDFFVLEPRRPERIL